MSNVIKNQDDFLEEGDGIINRFPLSVILTLKIVGITGLRQNSISRD